MRGLSSRKGVAEIIAALLLVCITLSAGIMLAVYASGLMGRLDVPRSQPYEEQLALDYYSWPYVAGSNPGSLEIIVRNDGVATTILADFFIQGSLEPASGVTFSSCPSSPSVTVQTTCTITLAVPSGLTVTQGTAYIVKLVTKDGAIFTFSCVYGSYTH